LRLKRVNFDSIIPGQEVYSLDRKYNDQILTSEAILDFCIKNIHGIKFFSVTPEEVAQSETELKPRTGIFDRFELARTIKGTLQFHRFIPVSRSRLQDVEADIELDDEQTVPLQIKLQSFVCCLYDDHPWIGMVDEISKEYNGHLQNQRISVGFKSLTFFAVLKHCHLLHPHQKATASAKMTSQKFQGCAKTGSLMTNSVKTFIVTY
jgi:hypothetical protein